MLSFIPLPYKLIGGAIIILIIISSIAYFIHQHDQRIYNEAITGFNLKQEQILQEKKKEYDELTLKYQSENDELKKQLEDSQKQLDQLSEKINNIIKNSKTKNKSASDLLKQIIKELH